MKSWISLICCFGLLLGVCGCAVTGTGQMLYYEGDELPVNLDPLLAQSATERITVAHLFTPLLTIGEGGLPAQGAAQPPTRSADGLTYTFVLRQDGMWSDGIPVTAADFAFALTRAVQPETKATCADQLTAIAGAKEILAGKADASTLGVKAVDAHTLTITLATPDAGLPTTLAGVAGMPCREDFFESCGGRYGMSKDHILSNGGFTLSRWLKEENQEMLRLSRSDTYFDRKAIVPSGITITFSGEGDRMFRFAQGDLDCASLSLAQLSKTAEAQLNTLSYVSDCYALVFNTQKGTPTANAHLRKALVGAMDLPGLAAHLPEFYESAQSLMIPGQYCGGSLYTPPVHRPEELAPLAQQNFGSAMKVLEADAVKSLTLGYPNQEGIRPGLDYLVQCWQKEFGIYVTLTPMSEAELNTALQSRSFDLLLCPMNNQSKLPAQILAQFAAGSENPLGGLAGKSYSALIASQWTAAEPLPVLQQCEAHLTEQCIAVPLLYSKTYYGYAKGLAGVSVNPLTHLPDFSKTEKFR